MQLIDKTKFVSMLDKSPIQCVVQRTCGCYIIIFVDGKEQRCWGGNCYDCIVAPLKYVNGQEYHDHYKFNHCNDKCPHEGCKQ